MEIQPSPHPKQHEQEAETMQRHQHDPEQTPIAGTQVGVLLNAEPAIVASVIGFNPAYDAWIVKAEWQGKTFRLPIFYRDRSCGWSERRATA